MPKTIIFILTLLLTSQGFAAPQGRFIVGEHDGEDFVYLLDFKRDEVFMETLQKERWSGKTKVEKVGSRQYRFTIPFPEEPQVFTLMEASGGEFVLYSPNEDKILRGFPRASLPVWLKGDWQAENVEKTILFKENHAILTDGKLYFEVDIYPLSSEGSLARVVISPRSKAEESNLIYFRHLDSNLLLSWDRDDGEIQKLHRSGWMSD